MLFAQTNEHVALLEMVNLVPTSQIMFWAALISLQGMEWVCPLLIKDLMVDWTTFPIRKKAKSLWQAALSSLCWAIWEGKKHGGL